MAKLAINQFEQLIKNAKDSTINYAESSPFITKGKSHAAAVKVGLDRIKTGLSFDFVNQENFDLKAVNDPNSRRPKVVDDLSLDDDPSAEKNVVVVVNWLINFVKKIMDKVNEHSKVMKFTQKVVDEKVDQEEFNHLKSKCSVLENECDEARQRGLKGNLILSSPNTSTKKSLLIPNNVNDSKTGAQRKEFEHEMCARLIKLKTGVEIPLCDIVACHPLKKRGSDSSYIVRIANRRSDSAWSILAAGMLTGKNSDTNTNFTQDNVYLNFQLTKKRSELLKSVRQAKIENKIKKYGVDQNGRLTVKVKSTARWEEVSSVSALQSAITNNNTLDSNRT